ncbi:hypothetical protein ACSBR2_008978 [Camellia fascicularis]
MELCIASTLSNLPHHRLFTSNHTHRLRWQSSPPLKQLSIPRTNQGLLYYTNSSLRSASEDTSSGPSQYVEESGVVTVEEVLPAENNSYAEIAPKEVAKEESALDGQGQAFEFLDELDIKFDSKDTYSILLFGGGALIALWIATAVVGAIDSIPLFPKLMEVVGLGYTVWFSKRYLIFKENREELVAKILEIKQQVVGSNDD